MFRKGMFGLMAALAVCLVSTVYAGEMSYSSDGFEIRYNDAWALENTDNGISITAPSGVIAVNVAVTSVKKKVKADAVLKKAEKDNGWKNEMGAASRKISKADLKKVGAESGYSGAYTLSTDSGDVKVMVAVFTLGKKVYTVSIAISGESSEDEGADLSTMGDSFRIFK